MRCRLRTLLIVLAVGPVILAAVYWAVKDWRARRAEAAAKAAASRAIVIDVIWPIYEPDIASVPKEFDREEISPKRQSASPDEN